MLSKKEQTDLFKTYVAIGDSLTYGCQGLNNEENRQFYSYSAQIARSMNTEFNLPLIKYPGVGIPNPEDALRNGWLDTYPESFNILIQTLVRWQRVDNYKDQNILNCFAASGATVDQMLSYDPSKLIKGGSSFITDLVGLVNPWIAASIGGRDVRKHKSLVDQALERNPTFLSVWLGNNDSIYSTILCDPGASTSIESFRQSWNKLIEKIKASDSIRGIVIMNLPDNTRVPYLQPVGNRFNNVRMYSYIPERSKVPFFVTDTYNISQVITPDEIREIRKRIQAFNRIIAETCEREGWLLIDCFKIFEDFDSAGVRLLYSNGSESDILLTSDFATGGFFSLDGLHPTSAGYAHIANLIIMEINGYYKTTIPLVDEVEVWKNDTLCQNPIDPREKGPGVMKNLTFIFNTAFSALGHFM